MQHRPSTSVWFMKSILLHRLACEFSHIDMHTAILPRLLVASRGRPPGPECRLVPGRKGHNIRAVLRSVSCKLHRESASPPPKPTLPQVRTHRSTSLSHRENSPPQKRRLSPLPKTIKPPLLRNTANSATDDSSSFGPWRDRSKGRTSPILADNCVIFHS